MRACSARTPSGLRNKALIAVLYRSGLRLAEALALEPKDVDTGAGTITVLHGKGDRRRVTGIDHVAGEVLDQWLARREALSVSRQSPVFCTLQGGQLQPSYVRALLPRLARQVGISKRVHPHGLRHTHAAELASEGIPVNLIQQQLGHASLATTDTYLRHIAPVELVRSIRSRTWEPGD